MRIFFIGTVQFSYDCLETLLQHGAQIVGVATKQQSKFNADFTDLTPLCESYQVPLLYATDINSEESIAFIRNTSPDVIYCFGWSSLIKTELLSLAPLGVVGYHPAALPHNRGRHPIIWALVLGLSETASTFFFMDVGADTGDILSQEQVVIAMDDDAQSLYDKLTVAAKKQIVRFTEDLAQNTFQRLPQDINQGNTWRKRKAADGKIDFRMSSMAIYNLVRGLTHPYVGAHVEHMDAQVKVWKVQVEDCPDGYLRNIEPGKILEVADNMIKVKSADGVVVLTEHEFEPLPKIGDYI